MPSADTVHIGMERRQRILADLTEHGPSKAGEIGARTGLTRGALLEQLRKLDRAGRIRQSMSDRLWDVA